MTSAFVTPQSADADASENLGFLHGFGNETDYVEHGLVVSVDWSVTPAAVSASQGKASILVPEETATWSDNEGNEYSEQRRFVSFGVWYNEADDPNTPHELDSGSETNTVYLVANLGEDDMPYLDVRAVSTGPPSGDDHLAIAEIDPENESVAGLNPGPDAFFESVETLEITDGAGVSHTGELADAADVRTDTEIRDVIGSDPNHGDHPSHNYLDPGHTNPTYDSDGSGTVDEAETARSVDGGDVSGAVASADSAAMADNAETVGGIDPANFLRTDTKDKMFADIDMNEKAILNVDKIESPEGELAGKNGITLDLRENSDGSYQVWRHDDPEQPDREWYGQSDVRHGYPFVVGEIGAFGAPDGMFGGGSQGHILEVRSVGDVAAPNGDLFTQDGMVATQSWVNNKAFDISGGRLTGDIDMGLNDIRGVSTISFPEQSGLALDLTPNSDGSHVLWEHDDGTSDPRVFSAQLDPAGGIPWKIRDSGRERNLIEIHQNGYISLPYGGLATDGPLWMGTHNHFGDDTTHDIIWKQDSNGREGHVHMHDDEVEFFPDGEPSERSFWTDLISGDAGVDGDLNVGADVNLSDGSSRVFGPRFVEYLSSGGEPAPPDSTGFRLYYYNNQIKAVNDAGVRETVIAF